MILTRSQEEAVKICKTKYSNKDPYTIILGYAGSGKSTLIPVVVDALGLHPERDVAYIAYTGKAALVMANKGCYNAQTAHRLLYHSVLQPNGSFKHIPKKDIGRYRLIIVDEVSMLPKDMWELLLSHHIPVIAFGDPGQLPPVKAQDNGMMDKPDCFLSEIVRQAQENEIIRLSMDVREFKPLSLYKGHQVQIIDPEEVIPGMYIWADQIICAKNATRRTLNQETRQLLYDVEDLEPVEGDKLICLNNYWEDVNPIGDALVNGTTGSISFIRKFDTTKFHPAMKVDMLPDGFDINYPLGDPYYTDVLIDYQLLTTGVPTVNENNWKKFQGDIRPREFDYGYAITAHKSQGSEYNKVLVFEENFPFVQEEHMRWLYTAITRAKSKLVVVRQK